MSDKHLKKLAGLGTAEWEALCRRCGRCCYEKLDDRGKIIYTDTPCDRFDPASRLCTVYDRRNRLRPDCLPLTPAIVAAGYLPADCPYVVGLENYPAPQLESDDEC